MFFLQKLSWEEYGFKFLLLNFQGTFPTLQNKTSNFKLPASVTPLAKRTYTGMIANTTVVVMLESWNISFFITYFISFTPFRRIWIWLSLTTSNQNHLFVGATHDYFSLNGETFGNCGPKQVLVTDICWQSPLLRDHWPGDGRVGKAEAPLPLHHYHQDCLLCGHTCP